MMNEAAGYYEMSTGAKVILPLEASTDMAKLAYFTTDEAAEYFRPAEPVPTPDPAPDPIPNPEPEPAPNPTPAPEPAPDDEDDDRNEPENPPTTDGDNPDTPQSPQEPPDEDEDDSGDYVPTTPHKPVETPITPIVTPSQLACGDATIDTTRSVVLAGYGDGQRHEDDPLTRAQLATIIYRLLDSNTIEKYGTDVSPFADIDSNAWCARYISTLSKAGIVAGIDNVNYAPSGLVTWAQALTVLSRFAEQQEMPLVNIQYDGWALKAIQTAIANHWIVDSADFNPDALITRGEIVNLINNILKQY